jgi:hypothetical protein
MLDSHLMMATGALEDEVLRSITLDISLDLNFSALPPVSRVQFKYAFVCGREIRCHFWAYNDSGVGTKLCIGERTRPSSSCSGCTSQPAGPSDRNSQYSGWLVDRRRWTAASRWP